MNRTVVLQELHGGHRLRYVRQIAESVSGSCVLVTTPAATASQEFVVHTRALLETGSLQVVTVPPGRGWKVRALQHAQHLAAGGRLVIPESDQWIPTLLLCWSRRSCHLRILVMRTPGPGWSAAGLRACLKSSLLRLLQLTSGGRIHGFFLTDGFGVVRSRRGYPGLEPLRDPSPGLPHSTRERGRRALGLDGLADEAIVCGMLGDLSSRKNPIVALCALSALKSGHLVLAGRSDSSLVHAMRRLAREEPGLVQKVRWLDGYLTEQELADALNALDVLLLLYDTDAPSGMLVSAVEAGVPVVAAGSPWVTRVVVELSLGTSCDLSPSAVAAAVTEAVSRQPRTPVGNAPSLEMLVL